MNGQQRLQAAASGLAKVLRDKATAAPGRPVRVGMISAINTTWSPQTAAMTRVAVITGLPGLGGAPLPIPDTAWSSAFLADVVATDAGQTATGPQRTLVGRPVEVHFTDDQPVIAYVLGG